MHASHCDTKLSLFVVECDGSITTTVAEMTQYVYQPLDESNNEIRLVTLLPSSERESQVICGLNIVHLTEGDVPRYEALSYTWGSAELPSRLRVSSNGDQSIDITRNLAEALPYLRYPVSPRILWIDSIAIDQKNLKERGQQVQRMANIFSFAERVVVWLGKDDTSSKTVMELCELVGTKVGANPDEPGSLRGLSDQLEDAHWSDVNSPLPFDTATWQATIAFLQRPWFHRLWIWQEIGLAKPNAVILCGNDTMHWAQLQSLINCIRYKQYSVPRGLSVYGDVIALVQNGYNLTKVTSSRVTVKHLLEITRHAGCVDPRDRVYGILGLSSKMGFQTDVRPDYDKPVVDVYMDLMKDQFLKSKRLTLLLLCKYDETIGNWPSWIPHLAHLEKVRLNFSYASGASSCEVDLLEERVLRVTGMRLGQITMVNQFDASSQGVLPEIRRWASGVDLASNYIDGKSMTEALCLAMCRGALADYYVPPFRALPDLASSLTILQDTVRSRENEVVTDQEKRNLLTHVFHRCNGQALFRTSSNHIGIGPRGAREGDQICVLLGCDSPMVIRADSNGRYKIIGEGYVSGLGSNEALLGPLPRGYRCVLHHDAESGAHYLAFLDSETGKIQLGDPRLGTELPSGWQRATDVQQQFWEVFSHDSAPDTWTYSDPRLTKSELLKRGVPLEDIEFS